MDDMESTDTFLFSQSLMIFQLELGKINSELKKAEQSAKGFSKALDQLAESGLLEVTGEILTGNSEVYETSEGGTRQGILEKNRTKYFFQGIEIGRKLGGPRGVLIGGMTSFLVADSVTNTELQQLDEKRFRSTVDNEYQQGGVRRQQEKDKGIGLSAQRQAQGALAGMGENEPPETVYGTTLLGKQEKLQALKDDVYAAYGDEYNQQVEAALDETIAYYEEKLPQIKEAYARMGLYDGALMQRQMKLELDSFGAVMDDISSDETQTGAGGVPEDGKAALIEGRLTLSEVDAKARAYYGENSIGMERFNQNKLTYKGMQESLYQNGVYQLINGGKFEDEVRSIGLIGTAERINRQKMAFHSDAQVSAATAYQALYEQGDYMTRAALGQLSARTGGASYMDLIASPHNDEISIQYEREWTPEAVPALQQNAAVYPPLVLPLKPPGYSGGKEQPPAFHIPDMAYGAPGQLSDTAGAVQPAEQSTVIHNKFDFTLNHPVIREEPDVAVLSREIMNNLLQAMALLDLPITKSSTN